MCNLFSVAEKNEEAGKKKEQAPAGSPALEEEVWGLYCRNMTSKAQPGAKEKFEKERKKRFDNSQIGAGSPFLTPRICEKALLAWADELKEEAKKEELKKEKTESTPMLFSWSAIFPGYKKDYDEQQETDDDQEGGPQEVNIVSRTLKNQAVRFASTHNLDGAAAARLQGTSDDVAREVFEQGIGRRVRNPSAYVTRMVKEKEKEKEGDGKYHGKGNEGEGGEHTEETYEGAGGEHTEEIYEGEGGEHAGESYEGAGGEHTEEICEGEGGEHAGETYEREDEDWRGEQEAGEDKDWRGEREDEDWRGEQEAGEDEDGREYDGEGWPDESWGEGWSYG